jgi:hypothetical protein
MRLPAAAAAVLALAAGLSAGGCRKPRYDTSTPESAVDAMAQMVKDGRVEMLPSMLFVEARDVTFADGVTEASAIEDVNGKAGEMLARLWRVSNKLKGRFPADVDRELAKGGSWATRSGFGDVFTAVMADPFGWLDANRSRLAVEDLGDGTASFEVDGKPAFGGAISMRETPDGWRVAVPIELARSSGYFPDTREEWAVLAYMMLAVENALVDFEGELDTGKFRDLRAASERAGRMVSESAAAQAIIFAMMQRNDPAAPGDAAKAPLEVQAGKVNVRVGGDAPLEKDLGRAGDLMRQQAEP